MLIKIIFLSGRMFEADKIEKVTPDSLVLRDGTNFVVVPKRHIECISYPDTLPITPDLI